MPLNVCVTFYSRTGNTREIAKTVASQFSSPTVNQIRPRVERTYANWLLRSLIPGSRVTIKPIQMDLREYDVVFLGTPKWSVSCPPFTEYLQQVSLGDVPTGIFLTYGGFDEERYLRRLVDLLQERGADVQATLRVQRDSITTPECAEGVSQFCHRVLPQGFNC